MKFTLIQKFNYVEKLGLGGHSTRLVKRLSGTYQILKNNCIVFESKSISEAKKSFEQLNDYLNESGYVFINREVL